MAFTLVNSAADDASSGVATASVTMDLTAGNSLVALATWNGNVQSVSSTSANGQSMTATRAALYSGNISIQIYYLDSIASTQAGATVSMTLTGDVGRTWHVFQLNAALAFDADNTSTGTGTTASTSVTTSAANAAMFEIAAGVFGGDFSPDTGYTNVSITNYNVYVGGQYDVDVDAAGAKTVQMTGGSQAWLVLAAAFKAAGGGGGGATIFPPIAMSRQVGFVAGINRFG